MFPENNFLKLPFALIVQSICFLTAAGGLICAFCAGKLSGFMKNFCFLSAAFLWSACGIIFLNNFSFVHSLTGWYVYISWNCCSLVPLGISLYDSIKKKKKTNIAEAILGMITLLLFCGALNTFLFYDCVKNGTFVENNFFREDNLHAFCLFMLPPTIFFFIPLPALTAVSLFIYQLRLPRPDKHPLLLSLLPAGFLFLTPAGFSGIMYLLPENIRHLSSALFLSALCLFFAYFPRILNAWPELPMPNAVKYHTGTAGTGCMIFLLLGLILLGFIARGI